MWWETPSPGQADKCDKAVGAGVTAVVGGHESEQSYSRRIAHGLEHPAQHLGCVGVEDTVHERRAAG